MTRVRITFSFQESTSDVRSNEQRGCERVRDVTDTFHQYRLLLREIWNRGFWADPECRGWDAVDSFNRLKPTLFKTLVLDRLGVGDDVDASGRTISLEFGIVPEVVNFSDGSRSAAVVILKCRNADDDRGDYDQRVELRADEVSMVFRDFFDWGLNDYRDLRYYLVRIVALPSRPELIGRNALVDVYEAAVIVNS